MFARKVKISRYVHIFFYFAYLNIVDICTLKVKINYFRQPQHKNTFYFLFSVYISVSRNLNGKWICLQFAETAVLLDAGSLKV